MSRIISTSLAKAGPLLSYKVTRDTGNRQAGGAILAACGLAAFAVWKNDAGAARAVALSGTYIVAFGDSHPLAKKIGAWPAVFTVTVTGVMAITSMTFGRHHKEY